MGDGATSKRAKRVVKTIIKQNTNSDEYNRYLDTQHEVFKSMNIIRNHLCQIYIQEINTWNAGRNSGRNNHSVAERRSEDTNAVTYLYRVKT